MDPSETKDTGVKESSLNRLKITKYMLKISVKYELRVIQKFRKM